MTASALSSPRVAFPRQVALAVLVCGITATSGRAADHPGLAVYREHCLRCHGELGAGTKAVPDPLVGEQSVNQLAAYIDETMPEDDPTKVTGPAARQVAEYIHEAFYSPVARDRNRPARAELARLTVRQYQNVAADLVGGFRWRGPNADPRRGLRGEYFRSRDYNRQTGLVFERIDPQIDFDFGVEGPDPEMFEPNRFAVRWQGGIVPPETGDYEFVIRTEHAVKLALNTAWYEPPLIDAYVKSGSDTEYRGSTRLLGGRAYPLRLEFSKANQGVDSKQHEYPTRASIQLLWKPPHGALEPVPERCLIPLDCPEGFVLRTPFPPDDKSIGYERGSQVSAEWFAATTAAATEIADHLLEHVEHLANVKRDAADRGEKLRRFAATVAERAFRRPLSADLRAVFVDGPFADAPDLDTGLKRSLLMVLESPRFLFRESPVAAEAFDTAARLSFGLWDSIPDQPLLEAAARGQLSTPDQIRRHAERMIDDRRTRAKIRDFLFGWLRVDLGPEIAKDSSAYPGFTPAVVADLRTSLDLFLDDCLWNGTADFRRLFTTAEIPLNGRLAPLYAARLRPDAAFTPVRLDDGGRGGLLGHPYLLSMLAYADDSSPIHRGVFLARSVLGNTLKPPQEAIAPLAPDVHPDLTTRERVALQTKAVACQSCHGMINPLGFALEEFDAIGRHRTAERRGDKDKAIDASGSYLPREGERARFRGAGELAAYVATSPDAQEAFVRNLFHALVKQPVRAWGPETLRGLQAGFAAQGFDIRRLMVDIMVVAAAPPPKLAAGTAAGPTPTK